MTVFALRVFAAGNGDAGKEDDGKKDDGKDDKSGAAGLNVQFALVVAVAFAGAPMARRQ